MKKLINAPEDVVAEAVAGFVAAHPGVLALQEDPLVVTRAGGAVPGKVGLVSGGGSGHEPLHTGYVGHGMLDAAVPGHVFTSPPPEPFLAAVRTAAGGSGVLLVVKNYTGDVLNAEIAAELADAEGIDVRTVLVADDVAVEDSTFTAGRRGVAGTLLVEKIAGAAAERGNDLAAVEALAQRVAGSVRSMGLALSAPTLPHAGRPSFDLADDEVELGVGIHGEPGRARVAHAGADALTDRLLEPVVADLGLRAGEEVLLLVNGMGATPPMELAVVYGRARARLEAAGVVVSRSLVGSYVTSLDMAGVSVSVLRLDEEMTELWDAPVCTAALRWGM
ncbi:dihydroxyacetone kinase subunit DhaK [Georgenia wangjunii]|uniref:dihydroxyacetone kinase subunit DhaK n=1 Tax=Georgenia wangjunii TaxID=3117730 RepID=UPI002F268FAD